MVVNDLLPRKMKWVRSSWTEFSSISLQNIIVLSLCSVWNSGCWADICLRLICCPPINPAVMICDQNWLISSITRDHPSLHLSASHLNQIQEKWLEKGIILTHSTILKQTSTEEANVGKNALSDSLRNFQQYLIYTWFRPTVVWRGMFGVGNIFLDLDLKLKPCSV